MKRVYPLVLVALMTSFAVTCTRYPASPQPEPTPPTTSINVPAWQGDWEKTLAAAKNEGTIIVLSSFGGEANDAIARSFKHKYGLDMEFVSGRSGEITTKVTMERRVGLYLEDVYLAGASSIIEFRDLGYLDPLKPLLVLPEVLDPKAWLGGEMRFLDAAGSMLAYQEAAVTPVFINTDIVKPDEIKSYRDLLHPKWQGKIVVMDPTRGSAGTSFFFILWELMGPDFTRDLAKQDLAITTDARQQAEWLARGKYPVSGNLSSDIYSQFLRAGAPIRIVQPVEGTLSTSSKGVVGILNRGPHPNAARVFVNWLLTRDVQTTMSRITDTPSRRLDISREGLDPSKILQPGIKYVEADSEESIRKKQELQITSRDVWNVKK